MREIIVMLLAIIEAQKSVIDYLCILVFGKAAMPQVEKPIAKAYLKLQVDPLPVFGKPEIQKVYDCDALIAERGIKPIRRRGSSQPPSDTVCPYCGASHLYIYNNNGSRGQFKCKVCDSTFFPLCRLKTQTLIAHTADISWFFIKSANHLMFTVAIINPVITEHRKCCP